MAKSYEENYLKDIYDKHLAFINDIKFTRREIDIIAFICSGRSGKKTASFLSISPKTVENHIHNIMEKLGCNSREAIIDFIEKTGKFSYIKKYYQSLQSQAQDILNTPFSYQQGNDESINGDIVRAFLGNRRRGVLLIGFFVAIGLSSSLLYQGYFSQNQKGHLYDPSARTVRSDLVVPTESTLLQRDDLLTQIENKFTEHPGEIRTLALTGIGGSGKTTIARQYAQQQNENVIWEINAETPVSLKRSVEQLAQTLAKNATDQKRLRQIQKIKNPVVREEKVIQFVKGHLKLNSDWLLIYDNVEEFSDIEKYFPQDNGTWGKGKIILTTRNNTIQNNKSINVALQIGSLNSTQKYNLFRKVMSNGNDQPLTLSEKEETIEFLDKLPSFPLDISIAAYYLKATHTAYSQYLENLVQNDKDFIDLQMSLLKGAGDYIKTRYGIVTLSIQHLMSVNKDFADLLLFISLLDSQEIPRDLLDKYKDSNLIDSFIYHLKKCSLLINNPTQSSPQDAVLSIHRSTQIIMLDYLSKKLDPERNRQIIPSIAGGLESYMNEIIAKEDFSKMKSLIPHLRALLSHKDLLPDNSRAAIEVKLGCVYYYTHYFDSARELLEKGIEKLNRQHTQKNDSRIAQALSYLGNAYKEIGNYEKGKKLLEEGISLYKKHDPKNYVGLTRALGHLGDIYKNWGDYKRAKDLLEESILISEKYTCSNHLELARTMLYLGMVHRKLGDYEKSITLMNNGSALFNKYSPDNYVAIIRALKSLGKLYKTLGRYEEAKDLLKQSLAVCEKHLPDNQRVLAKNLVELGGIHKRLGEYKPALHLISQSFEIHKKLFGVDTIRTQWVATQLATIYREVGDYERAEHLIQNSLKIYLKSRDDSHISASWVSLQLGYAHEDLKQYSQAKEILEKALIVHKKHFHENHVKIAAINFHLGNVYGGLGHPEKAKQLLEKSLLIYESHYGKDHIETARVVQNLGKIYLAEGKLDQAEILMNRGVKILQSKNHPSAFLVLEDLAELHFQKSKEEEKKGQIEKAQAFKSQAIQFLTQAFEIVSIHFPKDSYHEKRLRDTLRQSQSAL